MADTVGLHLYSIHHADHGLDAVERVARRRPRTGASALSPETRTSGAPSCCPPATASRSTWTRTAAAHPGVARDDDRGAPSRRAVRHVRPPSRSSPARPPRDRRAVAPVRGGRRTRLDGRRRARDRRPAAAGAQAGPPRGHRDLPAHREHRAGAAHLTPGRPPHGPGLQPDAPSSPSASTWCGATGCRRRVLLLGTGAYAGAVVAALAARGCVDIGVHSAAGGPRRSPQTHGVAAVRPARRRRWATPTSSSRAAASGRRCSR